MKFSLFVVALALMGCSSHKGQRYIASDESGDLVVRTFEKELSSDSYYAEGAAIEDFAFGTSSVMHDLLSGQTPGESESHMTMPTPEIPDGIVADLKLKRAFIYIKPKNSKNWFQQTLQGKKVIGVTGIDRLQMSLNGVDILKYQKSKSESDSESFVYVIVTEKIQDARNFFRKQEGVKAIHQMKSGVVVELEDEIASEKFRIVMTNEAESLNKLAITAIEQCSSINCLNLKGEEVNLVPLGKEELKFQAKIKSKAVAPDTKVDGFVEFEAKIQLDGI